MKFISQVEDVLALNIRGIHSLFKTTNNSLHKLLSETFTEFEFKPWKFTKVSSHFWKEKANQRLFLQDLAKNLQVLTHCPFSS